LSRVESVHQAVLALCSRTRSMISRAFIEPPPLAAVAEARRVANREDEGQGDERTHTGHLLEKLSLRVAVADQREDPPAIASICLVRSAIIASTGAKAGASSCGIAAGTFLWNMYASQAGSLEPADLTAPRT